MGGVITKFRNIFVIVLIAGLIQIFVPALITATTTFAVMAHDWIPNLAWAGAIITSIVLLLSGGKD